MNILLTGASGFLGRNFILAAPRDWRILAVYHHDAGFPEFVRKSGQPNVTAVRCNLGSVPEVAAAVETHGRNWDACLYLAAKVDIPWSVQDPQGDLHANVVPLLNTLQEIRAKRFIYFSSGAVYDGLEGEVGPDAPVAPTLPYAISKLTAERYVECYARRKKSIEEYTIVRFFGAYGPYEAAHKIYTRLIRAFAVEQLDQYTIYGDGRNLIDGMYVDDAVAAIRTMVMSGHADRIVNLAGGRPLPIESLVREAALALGRPDVQIRKEGVAHESNSFWGSTKEMRDLFGFAPEISLALGIQRFSRWMTALPSHPGAGSSADPLPGSRLLSGHA
jgi:nucleoside-diphosphate-sugar epimerase